MMKQEKLEKEDDLAISAEVTVKREAIVDNYISQNPQADETVPLFVCQICFKSYPNRRAFNDHQRKHKPATFECKICHKLFRENGILASHIKSSHETPRKYPAPLEERYCKECEKEFPTRGLLTRHLKHRHGSRSFKCSVCPKVFVLGHHVKRHERLVHKILAQKETTDRDDGFEMSVEEHPEEQDGPSSVVKEELIIEDVLEPVKTESELETVGLGDLQPSERDNSISVKEERSAEDAALDSGESESEQDSDEQPERPSKKSSTKCKICGKTLSTKTQLRLHVDRMHTDRQSSKRVGWNLKYHPDPENGLFHCDECNKSFTTRAQISGHVMKHKSLRERRFVCEPCDKVFSTRDNLRIHEERTHGAQRKKSTKEDIQDIPSDGEQPESVDVKLEPRDKTAESWSCDECDKSFRTQSLYDRHMERHHCPEVPEACKEDENGLLTCSECGKVFDNRKCYQSHARRHNAKKQGWYKCRYCDKHCGSKPDLERHEQVHADGSGPRVVKYVRGENGLFNCDECSKSFESRTHFCSHVLSHKYIREKRFSCVICDKAFGTKYALVRHEKDVHRKTGNE